MVDKNINIAVIGIKGYPPSGGSARAMENLLFYLHKQYSFTLYLLEGYTQIDKLPKYNNVHYIILKNTANGSLNTFFYYLKALIKILKSKNYDLVYLNHAESGYITPFLRIKYPVLLAVRGVYNKNDDKFGFFTNIFFKISEIINYKFASKIVSVSQPDILHIKQFTQKPVIHIPNGVVISNELDKKLIRNKSEDNFILFAAGRIYSIKGLHILINALNLINYKSRVVVIGDLSQVPAYKTEILKESVNLNIEFKEMITDKKLLFNYIRQAQVFIFPSLFEGMSNMLLEVASLQTPLICSNIPANMAVFNSNEVLYFESNNATDLSEKINWATNNYSQMEIKAKEAYAKIVNIYNWENISKQFASLFNKLSS